VWCGWRWTHRITGCWNGLPSIDTCMIRRHPVTGTQFHFAPIERGPPRVGWWWWTHRITGWWNGRFHLYVFFCFSYVYYSYYTSCPLIKVWQTSKLNFCDEIYENSELQKYLSMKEGSLFCFVLMRSTEPGCFRSCSWSLWKALDEEGCMGLVRWHLDLWCKSSWILNDFFTEN
jgi:hypothetical protein